MALVKCKECGHEISKKAKTCPNCGAKNGPKHYSLLSLIVWLFIGYLVYIIFTSFSDISENPTSGDLSNYQQESQSAQQSVPQETKLIWSISQSKDKITKDVQFFLNSRNVSSVESLGFPYNGVQSWIAVACDKDSYWTYFGFTKEPNISKDETKDGYSTSRNRVVWDESQDTLTLNQEWNSEFMRVAFKKDFINKLRKHKKLMLELNWHGEGQVYFEHDLTGSSVFIDDLFKKCGIK